MYFFVNRSSMKGYRCYHVSHPIKSGIGCSWFSWGGACEGRLFKCSECKCYFCDFHFERHVCSMNKIPKSAVHFYKRVYSDRPMKLPIAP